MTRNVEYAKSLAFRQHNAAQSRPPPPVFLPEIYIDAKGVKKARLSGGAIGEIIANYPDVNARINALEAQILSNRVCAEKAQMLFSAGILVGVCDGSSQSGRTTVQVGTLFNELLSRFLKGDRNVSWSAWETVVKSENWQAWFVSSACGTPKSGNLISLLDIRNPKSPEPKDTDENIAPKKAARNPYSSRSPADPLARRTVSLAAEASQDTDGGSSSGGQDLTDALLYGGAEKSTLDMPLHASVRDYLASEFPKLVEACANAGGFGDHSEHALAIYTRLKGDSEYDQRMQSKAEHHLISQGIIPDLDSKTYRKALANKQQELTVNDLAKEYAVPAALVTLLNDDEKILKPTKKHCAEAFAQFQIDLSDVEEIITSTSDVAPVWNRMPNGDQS